jgi:anti-anti-sigma factor
MGPAFAELDIVTAMDDDVAVVVLTGELEIDTAPRLIAMMQDIASPPLRRVNLDCAGVSFVDSAGVRALIVVHNAAARIGVDVEIVKASPSVNRVIEMTGLSGLLTGAAGR